MAKALLVAVTRALDFLFGATIFCTPCWVAKAFAQRARSVARAFIGTQLNVSSHLTAVFATETFDAQTLSFHANPTFAAPIRTGIGGIAVKAAKRGTAVAHAVLANAVAAAILRAFRNLTAVVTSKSRHAKAFVVLAYPIS